MKPSCQVFQFIHLSPYLRSECKRDLPSFSSSSLPSSSGVRNKRRRNRFVLPPSSLLFPQIA